MIPIRDLNHTRNRAVLTYALIALNVLVFLYEIQLDDQGLHEFVMRFGVVPAMLVYGDHPGSWVTPLTSMFMHGGWAHILGNMWFLHIFGDNVEDRLGRVRYVVFYVLCGFAAALAQVLINPASSTPMVGASGAIAGVLAAYVTLYPRARILTLVPIFIFLQFAELPAFFFIFIWFGYQLLMGVTSLGEIGGGMGGVAFFAHIGGFVAGLVLVRILRPKPNSTGGFRTSYSPPEDWRSGFERW